MRRNIPMIHALPLDSLFAVPLDADDWREPRPRKLPPVRISACADRHWVGAHFSRADWLAGISDGTFPPGTVAVIEGVAWRVVWHGEPSHYGPHPGPNAPLGAADENSSESAGPAARRPKPWRWHRRAVKA